MPWRSLASSLVLVATLLAAGCLEGGPDLKDRVPLQFGITDCTDLEVPGLTCTEQDGVVSFSGHVTAREATDSQWPTGLPINAGSSLIHTYHLRDLIVEGFGRGVHVSAIGHCDCTIILQNVTIRGPADGGQTGFSQVTHFNTYLPGKEDAPEAKYVFRDVHVTGMATALDLNLTVGGVELDGVRIDCVDAGIVARYGYGGVTARRLEVEGCSTWGLLLEAVGTSRVGDSWFTDNAIAVHESFSDAGGFRIDNVTFEGNGLAVVTALSANAGSISVPCAEAPYRIEGSRFIDNGLRSDWLDAQGLAAGAVLAGPFGVHILESSFERNPPAAITFVDSEGAADLGPRPLLNCDDAAQNYWGSPNGPWRAAVDVPAARSQFGDAVPTDLKVDPFLTQPP